MSRKSKKDRTSFIIAVVFHAVLILAVGYWAWKTGRLEEMARRALEFVRTEKKEVKKEERRPDQPKAQAPPKLPPINQGLPPAPGSGGTRRAVAADAPTAHGETFFADTRAQTAGPSTGGGAAPAARTNTPQARVERPSGVLPRSLLPTAPPSTVKQMLADRAKAAASIEAVGSEQISKAGASDAGAVITKVAGATVADGKFAVIRGLNERYVSTTLNGANLPSADPYRQSAPLDLFPAQVIDRVVVSKTFTPDQPGTATGGAIDVFTKSFPEKPFLSLSLGGAYNTQASLNDRFLTYEGGGLDWAGMDDGSRALPASVSALAPIGRPFPDAPVSSGLIGGPLYTQSLSNASLVDKVTRRLGLTQFAPTRSAPPLDRAFAMAGGGSTYLFDRPLGYFASASYRQDSYFYDNGIYSRYQNGTQLKSRYHDTRSLSVVNWSAMVNLAYRPLEDHELGFTFFYNQNGTDEARILDRGFETNGTGSFRKFNLYYVERNLNTYQMKGEHAFPTLGGLQFNWLVALTQTSQDEPDGRFFNDNNTGSGYATGGNGLPAPNKPVRYFRTLAEENQNVKLDWTLPHRTWAEEEAKLKFGLFDNSATRAFTERQFYYPGHGGYSNNPNLYLAEDQLGLVSIRTNYFHGAPRTLTYTWGDYVQIFDSLYDGDRDIQAGYLMEDLPVTPELRLVGGVRYETTDLFVHSQSYLASSITGQKTNNTRLQQADLLPSASLIYSPTTNMNVRLAYSQTIARPSFRELAAYYSWDPIISDFVEGNPNLAMTGIENYDLRWEWFPDAGELLGVSLFYKDLKNAIERGNVKVEGDVITFFNNDAKLYGIEFEARKNLGFLGDPLSPFSVGGNLALVYSEAKLSTKDYLIKRKFIPTTSDTRSLYDQAPYVLNLDLSYSSARSGTTAALVYNVAGPRITITKLNTEDVYEQPAPVLDFVISQRIGRNTTVKFAAKNLLNPTIQRTYGENSNLIYSSYTKGLTFGLTLNYEF